MKQTAGQESVNEHGRETWLPESAAELSPTSKSCSALWELLSDTTIQWWDALRRGLRRSVAAFRDPDGSSPHLVLLLDKNQGSLNLRVANRSRGEIWAEEVSITLDVESGGERYRPAQTVLEIHQRVAPSETLQISLINAVRHAGEQPQEPYSLVISTVLRYRMEQGKGPILEELSPVYRASMVALVPISLRRMGWFERPREPRAPANGQAGEGSARNQCRRRSQRSHARSAVIVEGRCNDGSKFSDSTHALVLSAHGCLVTLHRAVRIGESLLVRNADTRCEQRCEVVYVEETGGSVQVGLGFQAEAPEFWGVECLPSTGGPWRDSH